MSQHLLKALYLNLFNEEKLPLIGNLFLSLESVLLKFSIDLLKSTAFPFLAVGVALLLILILCKRHSVESSLNQILKLGFMKP
jgi:hypothetical protein